MAESPNAARVAMWFVLDAWQSAGLAWRPVGMLRRCVAAAVVLALSAVPAAGALAQEPAGPYSDVDSEAYYYNAVSWLSGRGSFEGTDCGQGQFCPDRPLKRWEMAVWLIRGLGGTALTPATATRFGDVSDDDWWMPYVERMADLEITFGCDREPLRFCPDQPVTRAQMASFLTRALDLPPAEPAGFTDVDTGSVHRDDINRLAAAEITHGCREEPLQFCPQQPVTRAQMAAFIFRGGSWLSSPRPVESHTGPGPTPLVISNDTEWFLTEDNEFSRYIKEDIVDRYGDEHPWLRDTWNHTNSFNFLYLLDWYSPSVYFGTRGDGAGKMTYRVAATMAGNPDELHGNSRHIWVHEMAHVYTLSNRVVANRHQSVPAICTSLKSPRQPAGRSATLTSCTPKRPKP